MIYLQETYWRIPIHFTAEDINLRVRLLNGELNDEDQQQDDVEMDRILYSTDEEDESEADAEETNDGLGKGSSATNNLIYNDSDNDDSIQRTPMKRSETITQKREKTRKKFDIFDMVKEPESEELVMPSQELRSRLATLVDSDDDSDNDTIIATKSVNKSHNRNAIIDTDSEDEIENTVLNAVNDTTTKPMASATLDSHFESSGVDGNHSSHNIGINVSDDVNGTRNNKRERSESDESIVDGENVVANKKARKLVSQRVVIDDDDDE